MEEKQRIGAKAAEFINSPAANRKSLNDLGIEAIIC
jgi:hypothetical protein